MEEDGEDSEDVNIEKEDIDAAEFLVRCRRPGPPAPRGVGGSAIDASATMEDGEEREDIDPSIEDVEYVDPAAAGFRAGDRRRGFLLLPIAGSKLLVRPLLPSGDVVEDDVEDEEAEPPLSAVSVMPSAPGDGSSRKPPSTSLLLIAFIFPPVPRFSALPRFCCCCCCCCCWRGSEAFAPPPPLLLASSVAPIIKLLPVWCPSFWGDFVSSRRCRRSFSLLLHFSHLSFFPRRGGGPSLVDRAGGGSDFSPPPRSSTRNLIPALFMAAIN